MKRWLAFLLALAAYAVAHEGLHALVAAAYGELAAFRIRPIGLEVVFRTPVEARSGAHWALISGASSLATLALGYGLLAARARLARLRGTFARAACFYLTVVLLLADPLNLSLGPLLYGGDANGIAVGLGIGRYLIQIASLVILLVNRELVAQRLFPAYGVHAGQILFRPWMRWPPRR